MTRRMWTVSNSISVFRVVLVLPLGIALLGEFEHGRTWAAVLIAVGIASDFLDGYLARRLHEVSEEGKIIDPLADKIGLGALVVFLVVLGDIPLWYALIVILRDLLILVGGLYIRKKKNIIPQSNWPGKVAVTLIAAYLLLSVSGADTLENLRLIALLGSILMMALSLAVYARRLFIGRVVGQKS